MWNLKPKQGILPCALNFYFHYPCIILYYIGHLENLKNRKIALHLSLHSIRKLDLLVLLLILSIESLNYGKVSSPGWQMQVFQNVKSSAKYILFFYCRAKT